MMPDSAKRGVDDPVLAEVFLQAVGHPEDAAERANVLAHQNHFGIVFEGLAQAGVDGAGEGQLGHQRAPSSG